MISISRTYKVVEGGNVFLRAVVRDSLLEKTYNLWYSVEERYGDYLCDEVSDSFVLVMLQIAMNSHQDIKVEGALSSTFYYNVMNTAMPFLTKVVTNGQMVKIIADNIIDPGFEPKGVGIGCSLGVDSFASILRQKEDWVPQDYRLTHLFIARAVHFGEKLMDEAEEAFRDEVAELQVFASEMGLDLVAVDSNIDIPYLDHREVHQLQRGVQMTLSAVLSLQKLFKHYVFASSFTAENFKLNNNDVAYCETAFVPALSTNSTELILATPMMSRVERTRYICNNPLVVKWLNVCWATVIENGYRGKGVFTEKKKRNCGKCLKCLRTLLTLEIVGDIEKYADIFDLDEYRRYRNKYLTFVLCWHKDYYFENELVDLIRKTRFKIPFIVYIYCLGVKSGLFWLYKKLTGNFILPQC